MMNIKANINDELKSKIINWYENIEEKDKKEFEDFVNNASQKELEEAFLLDMEFGTGGIRGIMGIGSFRMNKYTVGKATQGIANYFIKSGIKDKKVAISYDTRNNSLFFAQITASVFASNDFEVFLMQKPSPTPCLSYAVRKYCANVGVMITASHNPKEYNGYKLYDSTGCQITSPIDKEIIKEVNSLVNLKEIKFGDFDQFIKSGKIKYIDENEFYRSYLNELEKNLNIELIKEGLEKFKVVYTPLHGTGINPIKKACEIFSLKNIFFVEEQVIPDGNFSTLKLPNPEDKESFTLGVKKALQIGADIVLASDPDADRVGVIFLEKDSNGEIKEIVPDGNEIATMIFYYLLNRNKIKENSYAINTIVTTDLHEDIAKDFGVKFYRVLTGFKYIGEIINKNERNNFIFGGEESYGYLVGTHARDKDAIIIILLLIELFSYLTKNKIKVSEYLEQIYKKYGYYKNTVYSLDFKGLEGMEKMKNIMENLRSRKYKFFEEIKINKIVDYKFDDTGLPKSDVLQFFGDNFKLTVRPSGTEPKMKIYFQIKEKNKENLEKSLDILKEKVFKELK